MATNTQIQDEEITSLKKQHESKLLIGRYHDEYFGRLQVDIVLSKALKIICVNKTRKYESELKYLPPIIFNFQLPKNYPLNNSPYFVVRCKWLSPWQLEVICKEMDSIWKSQENTPVLNKWIHFLQFGVLEILNLEDQLDLTIVTRYKDLYDAVSQGAVDAIKQEIAAYNYYCLPKFRGKWSFDARGSLELRYPSDVITFLKNYEICQESEWASRDILCEICLVEKKDPEFFMFPQCKHKFCLECVKLYFEIQIKEGNINHLNCMAKNCKWPALPNQILEMIGKELFERYDHLLLISTLDSMIDVEYCPLIDCQCPFVISPDNIIADCPKCEHSFCISCKKPAHGMEPCIIDENEYARIVEEYQAATEEEKQNLERFYGKKQLEKFVEESLSEQWIHSNSKSCPKCKAHIEKIDGCHKMNCKKCDAIFCWLCMELLEVTNPYAHYNDVNSGCNNRLFEGVELEEFEVVEEDHDWEFGLFL